MPVLPKGTDYATLMAVAGEATCDPRTVERWLQGLPVRDLVRLRIEEAAKRRGLKQRRRI
jgi:hypothetical protein